MQKNTKLLTAILIFINVSVAFSNGFSIDQVCTSLTKNKITTGNFTQEKTSDKLARPLTSTGTFIFSEDTIAWNTEKPFKTKTVITKQSIVQTGLNGKKNVIDGSSNEMFKTVAATLSSLFSGNKEALETFFIIQDYTSTDSDWNLLLTPKDKTISSALKQVNIGGAFRNNEASLDNIKIVQNDSNTTTYKLSNQKYSQELTDEQKDLIK